MPFSSVPVSTRVLVLGLADEQGVISPADVYAVAELCGHPSEQVRSFLRHLVDSGRYRRVGARRESLYEPTAERKAESALSAERTRRAYAQDFAGRGWDGYWRLVAFAVPGDMRARRAELCRHLVALGGAAIHPGLYVSPHQWHGDVRAEADRLGLSGCVTYFVSRELDVAGTSHPAKVAQHLWSVLVLADAYEQLVGTLRPVLESLRRKRSRGERVSADRVLRGAVAMAATFVEVFERDPLLPPELLPRPWPGREARDLVREARRLAAAQTDRDGLSTPTLFNLFDRIVAEVP